MIPALWWVGVQTAAGGPTPFLPSGLVLATDMFEGLFVLQPKYQRGCYLEGVVTDANNGFTLLNVDIQLLKTSVRDLTNNTGEYAVGIADAGTYTAVFPQVWLSAGYGGSSPAKRSAGDSRYSVDSLQRDHL